MPDPVKGFLEKHTDLADAMRSTIKIKMSVYMNLRLSFFQA